MNVALRPAQAWRVAALTMMDPDELHRILSGDLSDAASWVEAAAACGLAEAQIRLGRMLLEGEGVAKDPHGAFACFFCAANSGDADAQNMLGRCYENGWGTHVDLSSAVQCYRRAADAGLAWAQYNLGHMLLDGVGITRDRDAAFVWYMRAAEQGHARAMNLVARCYEEGWGADRNLPAARRWYRKSAEGGYFRGAYNYASILVGEGCIDGAAIWFERALAAAPEPTHGNILRMLARHENSRLRTIAPRTSQQSCENGPD
ncbi:MAG: tetratricopeptide repeat protein [Rhizomicrobium sp.]